MKKTDIIKRLQAFPYDSGEYWVITGGAMGYTRPDGVHVLPISALKP